MNWKIEVEGNNMGEIQRQGYRLAWVKPDGSVFLFDRNARIRQVKQAIMLRIQASVKFTKIK